MTAGMTPFGYLHTAISLLPIVFGGYALVRDGRIDPGNRLGQMYVVTMVLGCVTGLMIFHHGGFTPGHVLSIIALTLTLLGWFAGIGPWLGRAAPYVQTIALSASYLLLMVFLTTESLTRLPAGHPYAPSPDAPELIPVRLFLLVAFALGLAYQVYRIGIRPKV